jgi:hypothetical protein
LILSNGAHKNTESNCQFQLWLICAPNATFFDIIDPPGNPGRYESIPGGVAAYPVVAKGP